MLSPQEIDELTAFMHELAEAAAKVTLPHFRAGLDVDHKEGRHAFDPVTAADRDAEAAIRKLIGERYPAHGILGEEHGKAVGSSDHLWVIDPIDGTRSFICGVPLWGTLVALNDGNRPVIGMMDQPFTRERFIGPGGTTLTSPHGTTVLKASSCKLLADAKLGNTDAGMFTDPKERLPSASSPRKCGCARFGGDCYFYCLLAAGTIDLVVETALEAYDIQALIPIIENARHRHRLAGRRPQAGGNVVAAATPELHKAALEILSQA